MKRKVYIVKDILSGPVVKTSPSNAGGYGFYPWSGSRDPTCFMAKKSKHKTEATL